MCVPVLRGRLVLHCNVQLSRGHANLCLYAGMSWYLNLLSCRLCPRNHNLNVSADRDKWVRLIFPKERFVIRTRHWVVARVNQRPKIYRIQVKYGTRVFDS